MEPEGWLLRPPPWGWRVAPLVLGGSGSQGGGGEGGATELALAWWGNPTRNKNTEAMIAAYMAANPNVKISGQTGEFSELLGQAGHPDRRRPSPRHHSDGYGLYLRVRHSRRSAGFEDVDMSKFVEGTVDSGKINDKLVGVNAGINSAVIMANPKVFEKAKMELPDDKTWTWDQLAEVAAEVASKAGVPFGMAGLLGSDACVRHVRCARTARNSSLRTGWGLR